MHCYILIAMKFLLYFYYFQRTFKGFRVGNLTDKIYLIRTPNNMLITLF